MSTRRVLTDELCFSAACSAERKRARCFDGGGLYLEVDKSGSKTWFWKYRIDDKEKRLSIGGYPSVSIERARADRDIARKVLKAGVDPVAYKHLPNKRFDRLRQSLGVMLEELRMLGGGAICPEIEAAVLEFCVRKESGGGK